MKHFLPLLMLTGLLFGQDVLEESLANEKVLNKNLLNFF